METFLLKLLNLLLFIIIIAFALILGIFMTIHAFGSIIYNRIHIFFHSLSQFINANIFFGHTDECISGRCYREDRIMFMKFINFVFFLQDNHCKQAYLNDISYAGRIMNRHKAVIKREGQR